MNYKTYKCDHPVYDTCTLYFSQGKALAIIQQRFNKTFKATFWTSIDDDLAQSILQHEGFSQYFSKNASFGENELYPTVTVRQVMWALKMKPLKKHPWETRW